MEVRFVRLLAGILALAAGSALAVDYGGVVPYAKDGRLRVLVTTAEVRHPVLPDVPTMKESGYPEMVSYTWSAIFVRAETPDAVAMKLHEAFKAAIASPEGRAYQAARRGIRPQ